MTRGKVNVRLNLVKLGQISKSKMYVQVHIYLVQCYLRSPKMSFFEWQLQMPKNASQRNNVIIFTRFLPIAQPKKKDIALRFCMLVVYMYPDNMYSVFWKLEKFWFYWKLLLGNQVLEFLWVKIETYQKYEVEVL